MTYEVLHGDCRALMADMEGCSVDSVATDPPYELGFMGREWDSTGVAYDVATWAEALRVLKPGGWLVAFGGSRTYHRMACAIEDAGFEIRDQIMWIYGSGFPKGGNRDGKGTCLKPAHEPIVLARKPLIGSVAANEAAFGTGALSIDACRVPTDERLRAGGGVIPMRHDPSVPRGRSGEQSATRRYDDRGATSFAPTPGPRGGATNGRWPANIVHDGSDEVLSAFPDAPGQQGDLRGHTKSRQSPNGIFGGMRPALDHAARGDTGSAARFFYCAKASKGDRDEGLSDFAPQAFVQFQTGNGESGNASSLSAGRDTQYRNTHPTVKPEALMRWLVRLITPPGGRVLDPFTGSGSTGKAAVLEGFDFTGCELTAEYLPIANARIAAAVARAEQAQVVAPQYDMFGGEAA
jgi:site-specific DNA-methyltransferase (adenine-specific)